MQYIGGKQKSGGAQIARAVNATVRHHGLSVVKEPFCGGLSVTSRLVSPLVASDVCRALITLYRAMQGGWLPPDLISRDEWERLRSTLDPEDPLTAFVGFGCSRSGNWFSGFAELAKRTGDHHVPAALAARESLQNKLRRCAGVVFVACDYRDAGPADLIYCDPPYRGTLPYAAVPETFDHDVFWAWARDASKRSLLAVSERVAPPDFVPLLTFALQNRLVMSTDAKRIEHLFVHESQHAVWRIA